MVRSVPPVVKTLHKEDAHRDLLACLRLHTESNRPLRGRAVIEIEIA